MQQARWLDGLADALGGGFSRDALRMWRKLRSAPRAARVPTQIEAPPRARHALATGSVIHDKYRLVQLLSEGGMGKVFKARHTHINLEFVVKVPNLHDVGSERSEGRFANEAHALACVQHDHVVKIIDAGRDPESDSLYLVEELLHGWDLRQCIAHNGVFSVPDTLQIMLPIMSALVEMHRLGMVHRDVKLENIFLARAKGGAVTSKLIDLGITRILSDHRSDERPTTRISRKAFHRLEPQLTARGERVGTRAYMAPEQFIGGDIDERTDVWGVGATLYAMLLGEVPFPDVGTDEDALAQRHCLARLESRVRSVSSAVADVIHKALNFEPGKRHPSMSRFIEALVDAADLVSRVSWPTAFMLAHLTPRSQHAARPAAPPTEVDLAATTAPSAASTSWRDHAPDFAQTHDLARRYDKTIVPASRRPPDPTERDTWSPTEPVLPRAAASPGAPTVRGLASRSSFRTFVGLSVTLLVAGVSIFATVRPSSARPQVVSAARGATPAAAPRIDTPRAPGLSPDRPLPPPPAARRSHASAFVPRRAVARVTRPTAPVPVRRVVTGPFALSTPGIYRDVPYALQSAQRPAIRR